MGFLGDFNGDGKSDILWRNDNGQIVCLADERFAAPSASVCRRSGNDWHIVGTGDFNGDGNDDILWRNDSGFVVDGR